MLRARTASATPAVHIDMTVNSDPDDRLSSGVISSTAAPVNATNDNVSGNSATTSPSKESAATTAARVRSQMRAAVNAALHECAQVCKDTSWKHLDFKISAASTFSRDDSWLEFLL